MKTLPSRALKLPASAGRQGLAVTEARASWGAAQPQRLATERAGEEARSEAGGKLQARALSCGVGAGLFLSCRRGSSSSGSSSAFAPSRARSVPAAPSPLLAQPLVMLSARSWLPPREPQAGPNVDPTWNWQKPGVKTQPGGLKSGEISPGRFFSLKSPLAPSRAVQRPRPSLRRGQGAQPKLFIHHFAPHREERGNGTPGEIRHGCCSCARREPRPVLRAHRCI